MVLLGLLAGPVQAGVLAGRVLDQASQDGLGFASVVVESADFRTGVIADETGRYTIRDLPAGLYTLTFHYIGYSTEERTVLLGQGDRAVTNVSLAGSAIEMETVEVTARRFEKVQEELSTLTLTQDQMKILPAFGETDPIRTLQFLPGVQTASDISSGLYVRGGGPDQTLILLDQIPIYNPTHAFGLFSTFNADAVGDVTLYKGAYPARYGGRLGSVLDVQSRNGRSDKDGVHGTVGLSVISGRLSLDGPAAGGRWAVSARRTYLDPVLNQLRKSTPEIPEYYFYDVNTHATIPTRGRAGNLSVTGFLAQDDLFTEFDAGFVGQRWGNQAGAVKYQTILGDSWLGSVAFSGSRYHGETEVEFFNTAASFSNGFVDFATRLELEWEGTSHRVTSGVEATAYQFDYEEVFNRETNLKLDRSPRDLSWFVEDSWDITSRWTVTDGLRMRYFSEGDRVLYEPRLAIEWAATETVGLQLAGGAYHQYLQLISTEGFSGADLYVPLDDSVDPGRSYQTVAGVTWDPSEDWGFSAEAYGTLLRDLIVVDDEGAGGQTSQRIADVFKTGGKGYATGIELFAQKRTGRWKGWLGYTLGWTRRKFDDVNEGKWFAPKYDRRHDINAVANYDAGPWTYSAAFLLGTGQAFTPAAARYGIRNPATGVYDEEGLVLASEKNSGRLLPYHRLDLSVAKRFQAWGYPAQWSFQVFNAYSRRNEWFVQYNTEDPTVEPEVAKQLPIIPTLGVSFDF